MSSLGVEKKHIDPSTVSWGQENGDGGGYVIGRQYDGGDWFQQLGKLGKTLPDGGIDTIGPRFRIRDGFLVRQEGSAVWAKWTAKTVLAPSDRIKRLPEVYKGEV